MQVQLALHLAYAPCYCGDTLVVLPIHAAPHQQHKLYPHTAAWMLVVLSQV